MPDCGIHKILAADDGTPEGERAAYTAIELAVGLKADVLLLGVVPPQYIDPMMGPPGYNPAVFRRKMEERFWRFRKFGETLGMDVDVDVVDGRPADQIRKRAAAEHVDLIVIGRHKVSPFLRLFVGSTSETVVRGAHCSVMVAR